MAPYGRVIGELLDDVTTVTVANITDGNPMNYEYKTVHIQDKSSTSFYWAILFTVLGTLLLDFNADNCQTPSRAYLLDICIPEEHGRALSTFTIMAGFGGCLGYALGAIDWDKTIFANLIGDNIKTVFALVTVLFICTMLCTITSFREVPLKMMESDEMLKPVTQMAVKKEKEKLKALDQLSKEPSTTATMITEKSIPSSQLPSVSFSVKSNDASSISLSSSDDDEDEEGESVTLMMYLKSIIFMPKSLRILCLTNCLSWMGHIVYCLYFTDFVGEAVFGGDPAAPIDSPEYEVRFHHVFFFNFVYFI